MDKEQIIALAEETDDGSGEQYFIDQDGWITEFATKLLESYKAELLKEVGEPVYVVYNGLVMESTFIDKENAEQYARNKQKSHDLSGSLAAYRVEGRFTSDQVAAAIESYKAELLKEVGEPVGYLHQWIEYHPYGDTVAGEPCSAITNDGKPFDKSDTVTLLFTSDQVAAAIIKATKPLEERRCEVCGYAEHHREHTGCLRKQIEKLTAERDAALARLSEERDIWDRMLGDAADKFAHLEREIDDCLYVLDALWDKQCDKIVTQKWAEILIRNKRVTGASSAEDSSEPTSSE